MAENEFDFGQTLPAIVGLSALGATLLSRNPGATSNAIQGPLNAFIGVERLRSQNKRRQELNAFNQQQLNRQNRAEQAKATQKAQEFSGQQAASQLLGFTDNALSLLPVGDQLNLAKFQAAQPPELTQAELSGPLADLVARMSPGSTSTSQVPTAGPPSLQQSQPVFTSPGNPQFPVNLQGAIPGGAATPLGSANIPGIGQDQALAFRDPRTGGTIFGNELRLGQEVADSTGQRGIVQQPAVTQQVPPPSVEQTQLTEAGQRMLQNLMMNPSSAASTKTLMELIQDPSGKPQPKLTDISSMRGQFLQRADNFREAATQFDQLRSGLLTTDPTGFTDLGLVSGYAKILDPESVVREEEGRLIIQSAAMSDRHKGFFKRLFSGEVLPEASRLELLESADRAFKARTKAQTELERTFGSQAKRSGIDPRQVIGDGVGQQFSKLQPATPQAITAARAQFPESIAHQRRFLKVMGFNAPLGQMRQLSVPDIDTLAEANRIAKGADGVRNDAIFNAFLTERGFDVTDEALERAMNVQGPTRDRRKRQPQAPHLNDVQRQAIQSALGE